MRRHLIYITRKFPPSVGGMETLASGIWQSFRSINPSATLISHGGSNRRAAIWIWRAIFRLWRSIRINSQSHVVCGDVALYLLIGPILRFTGTSHSVVAHGLDLTFDKRWYQELVRWNMKRAPKVLVISRATGDLAVCRGARRDRVELFRLGIPAPRKEITERREQWLQDHRIPSSKIVLGTLGRLVERKGGVWFLRNVFPKLDSSVHMVIAGEGPELESLVRAIEEHGTADRVHLLGRLSDQDRQNFYDAIDIFVQPNVNISGDVEGYGLVTIEAAMSGCYVVAAKMEGLVDALSGGQSGDLLEPENHILWIDHLNELIRNDELPKLTLENEKRCRQLNSLDAMEQSLRIALMSPSS